MMPAAPVIPVIPNGAKSAKLSVFQPKSADHDEQHQHRRA